MESNATTVGGTITCNELKEAFLEEKSKEDNGEALYMTTRSGDETLPLTEEDKQLR